jgi:hypothetical protein
MAEKEDIVITKDQFGRDVTVSVNEDGYITLYRATDDPNRIVNSDFSVAGRDAGSVGFGQQSYFSTNPMYAYHYDGRIPGKTKTYKFNTNIKPSEVLPFESYISDYPELAKALNIPEEFWIDEFGTKTQWNTLLKNDNAMIKMGYEAGGKRFLNDKIQVFIDNGFKAFGTLYTGTGGQTYIEYEIVPLIKEGDTLGIKPVAQLTTKEGYSAGKVPEAFTETPLDTPTNVSGAEVIDEIEGIQRETIEKLRNANDAFVAEQVDDIMARKINEVLPFVDTSLSRAEAIGISTTGPQITTSADPVLWIYMIKENLDNLYMM